MYLLVICIRVYFGSVDNLSLDQYYQKFEYILVFGYNEQIILVFLI